MYKAANIFFKPLEHRQILTKEVMLAIYNREQQVRKILKWNQRAPQLAAVLTVVRQVVEAISVVNWQQH